MDFDMIIELQINLDGWKNKILFSDPVIRRKM